MISTLENQTLASYVQSHNGGGREFQQHSFRGRGITQIALIMDKIRGIRVFAHIVVEPTT